MIHPLFFALVLGALFSDPGESNQNHEASTPTLKVCEVLSRASEFDGKILRIRDQIFSTDEGTWFVGEGCPGIFVTDGKVWPSSIAWTSPGQTEFILHPVNFSFDNASLARLAKKWKRLRKQISDGCIAVTYTGMFEVWSKEKARKTHPNGIIEEIPGFGHLNGAPAQLVLKSADDVAAIPNCTPKQ